MSKSDYAIPAVAFHAAPPPLVVAALSVSRQTSVLLKHPPMTWNNKPNMSNRRDNVEEYFLDDIVESVKLGKFTQSNNLDGDVEELKFEVR